MNEDARSVAFLAVISCGGSSEAWPIELAWGFSAGPIGSMMVKPASGWSLAAWDKGSEALHGIKLEALLQTGKAPLDACLILNAALGQSDVFAVAPDTDSLWLYKLYKAAGVEPNFRLQALAGAARDDYRRAEAGVERLREAYGARQSA